MKSTLRTQIAVAALLAPLGAALAQPLFGERGLQVQQGGAPVVVAQAGVYIEQFTIRADQGLGTGGTIHLRVLGTPGARAWLEVPGNSLRNINIPETRPGVYEISHVISQLEHADAYRAAFVTLERGGARQTAMAQVIERGEAPPGVIARPVAPPVAPPVQRPAERRPQDKRAPQIWDMTPSNGERIRERGKTEVSARVRDDETGLDRGSLVLRIDGRDVTRRARFEGEEVVFREDLNDGRHTAELVVRDRAGNLARRSWSFEVDRRGRR